MPQNFLTANKRNKRKQWADFSDGLQAVFITACRPSEK
ncbi:hypothetical protein l11_20840 [Neisseria weaveri LMG 5135]|nr:hypothetical protein l11_20840 [Neisseria weaveri LMG 5135]EGV35958.1 hypothetical protein l13_12990 [Neisseria weaveri ATCC 51223]